MNEGTLVFIVENDTVLLGYKKRGEIGTNTLNAPGGKCEDGESLHECAVREVLEEVGVVLDPADLDETARITFYAGGTPDFEVHIYRTSVFSGGPVETDDMVPGWYDITDLPFEHMLESDREWFERAARGERFRANVYYRERAKGFERIEFFPYETA